MLNNLFVLSHGFKNKFLSYTEQMNEDSNQLEGNVSNYYFTAMTGKGGKNCT